MGTQLVHWNNKELYGLSYPQGLTAVDGNASWLGNPPSGASFETGGSVLDQANQRIVRYRGHSTFVAVQEAVIYRSTDGGSNWSSVLSDADLGSGVVKSGLYVVEPAGTTELVILTRAGSGSYAIFTSPDGSTWTKHGPYGSLTDQSMALQAGTIWRDRLFCAAGKGSSGRSYCVDLVQRTLTQATLTGLTSNFCDVALCVFNDRLFGLWHKSGSTATLYEYQLASNVWVEKTTLGSGLDDGDEDRKSCLFVQGAHMYAVFCRGSGDPIVYEWKAYQIDASLSTSDVSDVLDPVDVHAGTSPGAGARVAVIADGPAGGGGNPPEIDLYFAPDAFVGDMTTPTARAVVVFRWNGPSTDLTELDNGSAAAAAWPFGVQYSGNVFWSSGNRVVEQVSSAPADEGVRKSFKLYSPNGSPDYVDLECFYGTSRDEYACGSAGANDNAVLADPSAGSLSGQTVQNLDASDNGSTTFEVTWVFGSQSQTLENGGHAKFVMEIV